jgi:hypothetical protein
MVFGKLLAKREKREKEEEDAPAPVIRGFSAKEVWDLRLRLHEASREIDQQGWTQRFKLADRKGEGHLSFDDFRRAVRSANIKSSVISDFDLEVRPRPHLYQSRQLRFAETHGSCRFSLSR